MTLVILFMAGLALLRVIGEVIWERKFPANTLLLFVLFIGIAVYALINV